MTTERDTRAVVDALRGHDRFLVTTHENPDGDALGSLLAMQRALLALGKDSVMYLGGPAPFPAEYRFLELDGIQRQPPDDHPERVLVAVDCAQESRIADPAVPARAPLTINIDHHHDNTRFGAVNLVVPEASSTGEVLADLFAELDVEITPELAESLYTALVTDTGRFQYANTTPKALRLAADLVEAGADAIQGLPGRLRDRSVREAEAVARAPERARVHEGGRIVISYLLRNDFPEVGGRALPEGIIDHSGVRRRGRATGGPDPRAAARSGPSAQGLACSSVDEIDVSAIAAPRWRRPPTGRGLLQR